MTTKFDAIVDALESALATADPGTLQTLANAVDDYRVTRARSFAGLPTGTLRLFDVMLGGIDNIPRSDDDLRCERWKGCLPDGDPMGPFATEADARADESDDPNPLAEDYPGQRIDGN